MKAQKLMNAAAMALAQPAPAKPQAAPHAEPDGDEIKCPHCGAMIELDSPEGEAQERPEAKASVGKASTALK